MSGQPSSVISYGAGRRELARYRCRGLYASLPRPPCLLRPAFQAPFRKLPSASFPPSLGAGGATALPSLRPSSGTRSDSPSLGQAASRQAAFSSAALTRDGEGRAEGRYGTSEAAEPSQRNLRSRASINPRVCHGELRASEGGGSIS